MRGVDSIYSVASNAFDNNLAILKNVSEELFSDPDFSNTRKQDIAWSKSKNNQDENTECEQVDRVYYPTDIRKKINDAYKAYIAASMTLRSIYFNGETSTAYAKTSQYLNYSAQLTYYYKMLSGVFATRVNLIEVNTENVVRGPEYFEEEEVEEPVVREAEHFEEEEVEELVDRETEHFEEEEVEEPVVREAAHISDGDDIDENDNLDVEEKYFNLDEVYSMEEEYKNISNDIDHISEVLEEEIIPEKELINDIHLSINDKFTIRSIGISIDDFLDVCTGLDLNKMDEESLSRLIKGIYHFVDIRKIEKYLNKEEKNIVDKFDSNKENQNELKIVIFLLSHGIISFEEEYKKKYEEDINAILTSCQK